jgi:hypothetical protein
MDTATELLPDVIDAEVIAPDFLTLSPEDAARAELCAGLRAAAKFIETHPRVNVAPSMGVTIHVHCTDTPEGARAAAIAMAPCKKSYGDELIKLTHEFGGGVELQGLIYRSKVCSKVVVGKRVVPKKVIPAQPERVIEEHEEDVTEWDCKTPPSEDAMRRAIEAPDGGIPF